MKCKEFLNSKDGYTLEILPEHAGDDKESGLIEVPEGAECCTLLKEYLIFWKGNYNKRPHYDDWLELDIKTSVIDYTSEYKDAKIIWKREPRYKEFLNSKDGYTLEILPEHAGDDKESGLIEVPEGAEFCAKSKDSPYVFFAKNSGDTLETFSLDHKNKWYRETTLCIDNIHVNYLIVWQRPTQPEELPFIDDEVNQPSHYTSHPSGIECIEITRHHDFAIGNAIKYLWRAGLKNSDNEVQDLEKAAWYIQDKIKQLKGS